MQISDIKRVVEQVSRDKGIERTVLIKALEEALKSAARKKFGSKMDIEVQYNEESGEIEVFQFKDVAEVVTEPALEISLEEGRKLDPGCEIGDSLGTKMDTSTFGRIAAQSAKQVIIQKMKDAEKDAVYASFVDRKGETINGIVQRIDRGDIIVNLGHTEGIVHVREQVPKETYRRGDRIRAYIFDVLHESRGPQIILSRTHPNFLIHLFRTEVPEIRESIVTIMGAAREPGIRAKIAVASNNSDIDPVGACVGMKGSRVQNVVQELRGEKIDIIPWHIDPAKFVCNALAPAEISRVIIDEGNQTMEVIVPDDFLSIAIGKKGQNVRLASKLTSWNLDVKSETKYTIAMQSGYDSLVALPGVGISMADALYELGFYSAEEVSNATPEDLIQIRGIGEETAKKLIAAAQTAVEEAEQAEELEEETTRQKSETTETDAIEGNAADPEIQTPVEEDPQAEEIEKAEDEAATRSDAAEAQDTGDDASPDAKPPDAQTPVEEDPQAEEIEKAEDEAATQSDAAEAQDTGDDASPDAKPPDDQTPVEEDPQAEEIEKAEDEAATQSDAAEAQDTGDDASPDAKPPDDQTASEDVDQDAEDTPDRPKTDRANAEESSRVETDNAETDTKDGSTAT